MRKIGKRGRINQKARDKIAEICEYTGLEYCEAKLEGCIQNAYAPAHRHKRRWYYDKPDNWLWNMAQWIAICPSCDRLTEYNSDLLEELFIKLRGKEEYFE